MRRLTPTILLLGALLLGACSRKETRVDRATRDKILLYANGSEPADLDPHLVSGDPENKVLTSLIEGLIAYHPNDDYQPEPGVAESWEMKDLGKTWIFNLRKNAKWSNGDPVTAHDFVWSHKRALSPALAGDFAPMLFILENAEAFNKEEITDFTKVGVKAIDDHTIEYTLTGPTPYFVSMLKHYSFWPVHKASVLAMGKIDDRATGWTRPGKMVSNGPFVLDEWKFKNVIKVKKNPHYWDVDTVKLNAIHFFPVENVTTEERMFRDGQVHVTKETALDKIPWYRENRPDLIHLEPWLCVYYYVVNTTKPPFDNRGVRRALSLAINREAITKNITRAGEIPAYGYVPPPPGETGYKPPDVLSFNPEAARKELADAGYPDGKGFPRVKLLFNTHESHRTIAEAVQEMWKKHLNIDIELNNQTWQVYLDSIRDKNYDVARRGWIGDYMDPITFLIIMQEDDPNNGTGYANPEYDKLLKASGQEVDPEKRFAILKEAERLMLEDAPIIPFYWYVSKHLVHPDVKGWSPKLLDNYNYKYLDVEPSNTTLPRDMKYVA
ncbi:MAG: peptide ABC transporter substrate-binding protein, partial [Verrucomicrobiales bacterium]|nr:peptide ABC transporter substrate-binding protein [Verrucomicrobiales bacterium]